MALSESQMQRAREMAETAFWGNLRTQHRNYSCDQQSFTDGYLAACAELMPPEGQAPYCYAVESKTHRDYFPTWAKADSWARELHEWGNTDATVRVLYAAPSAPERQKREEGE